MVVTDKLRSDGAQMWLSNIFLCCSSCYTRKGKSEQINHPTPVTGQRRIVVLGSSSVGKSHVLSLLSDTKLGTVYEPTMGSHSERILIDRCEITLVEIGGNLRSFWGRSLSSRTDAIWFMLSAKQYLEGDFGDFDAFFTESHLLVNREKIGVYVTIVGDPKAPPEIVSDFFKSRMMERGIFSPTFVSVIQSPTGEALRSSLRIFLNQLGS
jgi:hypothetical protein